MSRLFWRLLNLFLYGLWTDCHHGPWPGAWEAIRWADWRCPKCGAEK